MLDLNALDCDQKQNLNIKENHYSHGHNIAIIGLALRLPGAPDKNRFWENLKMGKDCITSFPSSRRKDTDAYLRYVAPGKEIKYRQAGYLETIHTFDYGFFGLSPAESALIDPNQRLFLETAWQALEDGGYGGEKIRGSETGVYLGFVPDHGYKQFISKVAPYNNLIAIPGNLAAVTASRISYLLNLGGPAMVTDTACSSSLVAVHLACQGILNGDCTMALAGGVKLLLLLLDEGEKLDLESTSAQTRAFDEAADGTCFGEGAGVILLKPLEKAMRDKDHIYAVIKGSAINQDGRSAGLTAPNAAAQSKVIEKAWQSASIQPERLAFIEAHGTGTRLGDPIEIDGLTRAFAPYTTKKQFCALGSVKTNIGHLDSTAGIAGLIKSVLALYNKQLPPSLHFETPNREINFKETPVFVNRELLDLQDRERPLLCGVSAFGLSGTNSHVILEEAPVVSASQPDAAQTPDIFVLSAKEADSLQRLVEKYLNFLETHPDINLNDLCYTAATGRVHLNHRLVVIASSINKLKARLQQFAESRRQDTGVDLFYGSHKIVCKKTTATGELLQAEQDRLTEQSLALPEQEAEKNPHSSAVLRKLGNLYVSGAEVDWERLYAGRERSKVSLPTYSFSSNRCWLPIPGQLPELWTDIKQEMETYYTEARDRFNHPAAYPPAIAEFAIRYVIKVLKEMGIIPEKSGPRKREAVIRERGVVPQYHRFVSALLDLLEEAGYLEYEDQQVLFLQCLYEVAEQENFSSRAQDLYRDYPDFCYYIKILARSISGYQAVLTGRENGTNIVFPDASTEMIENIYKDDKHNDSCNELAAKCVATIADVITRSGGADKVRILEVGAGIGGTSEWVFKALGEQGKSIEYYYTDLSSALLIYGKNTYGKNYPFVTFQRLDLEKELSLQGFAPCSFDIILAANVIHATTRIARTLDRLATVLKDNGFLLLVEGIRAIDFSTLAFGILDGWWLYEDEELRIKNAPMLSVESWKQILFQQEFANTWVAGEEEWNQRLIVSTFAGVRKQSGAASIPGGQNAAGGQPAAGLVALTGRGDNDYTEIEKTVARIWGEILGLRSLSIFDDFFSLGGDSIIATKILNGINSTFPGEIDFSDLLNYCTVEELAQFIETGKEAAAGGFYLFGSIAPIQAAPYRDDSFIYPAASAQKRIFALCQLEAVSTTYNVPGMVFIRGPLDQKRLTTSFTQLVERHETLRTSFEFIDGKLMQRIHKQLELTVVHTRGKEEEAERIQRDFMRPFNLGEAPLLRVQLTTLGDNYHLLLIDIHHIISDGISINILIREFAALHTGEQLPPLKIQYKDYTAWQHDLYNRGLMKQQEEYWLKTLGGELPLLDLPTDYPRPARQSFEGETLLRRINEDLYKELNQTAAAHGATLFMVLLAAYTVLLAKYTNQDDILVGTPIAGRRNKDLEQVIGMFVNTLVLRNSPRADQPFNRFLEQVKATCLGAFENQDYQFDMLVDLLNYKQDLRYNPIFDTILSVQNINDVKELVLGELQFTSAPVKTGTTRFALYINTLEKKEGVFFELQYCTKLYKPETALKILDDFMAVLKQVTENPHTLLQDIKLQRNYRLLENVPGEEFSFNFEEK